jgi:RsiW-degrading membrane proteinase PrsW (M82 family)
VALLPVALLRLPILRLISGDEILSERDDTPASHQSPSGLILSLVLACLLFFTVYVWVDAAGTRPAWFNLLRTFLSGLVSSILCVLLSSFIFSRSR